MNGQRVVDQLKSFGEKNNLIKESEKHRASLERTYGICKLSLSAHLVSSPKREEVEKVRDLIAKIRIASRKVAYKIFGSVDPDKLDALVQGIEFQLPSSDLDTVGEFFF